MEKLETERIEIVPFNLKTGEIVRGRVITLSMEAEMKRKKERQQIIDEKYRDYGNFYWFFYNVKKQLFGGNIDGATATRLIYLATYMRYKDNLLVFKNGRLMHKKDLQDVLGLAKKQFFDFLKKCKENRLLCFNADDTVKITYTYFKKGRLSKKDFMLTQSIARIYCDTIQCLYNNCSNTYHKNLGYMFALIPYVNADYNIICDNPWEDDLEKVRPLNLQEICNIVGYDVSQASRLKKALMSIKINDKPAVSFVENCDGIKVFINPVVLYGGDRHDEVKILGKF